MEVLETIEKVFGHNIGRFRESLGLSQDEMAHRLEVPESTYKRWEQGRAMPDSKHRHNLQKMGIQITKLFVDPDFTEPSDEQIIAKITEKFGEKLISLPAGDPLASLDEANRAAALRFIDNLFKQQSLSAVKGKKSHS